MKKLYFVVILLFISITTQAGVVIGANYSPGTYNENLIITERSTLSGGTYIIHGDFEIATNVIVTVTESVTIYADERVIVRGTLETLSKQLDLTLKSKNHTVWVYGYIYVFGGSGSTGLTGDKNENGTDGETGFSSTIEIISENKNVYIWGNVNNYGGKGGTGGEGGRSSSSGDAGNGGEGGRGSDGGDIIIKASNGKVEIKGAVSSKGGTGGTGGKGGSDHSFFFGASDGGNGGQGGNGGTIKLIGQEVTVLSGGSFNSYPGGGGDGGDGGDGGTVSGDGDPGDSGPRGTSAGSITVYAGILSDDTGLIRKLDNTRIQPSTTQVFVNYDNVQPENIEIIDLPSCYFDGNMYYTNSPSSEFISLMVPEDRGIVYDKELISGIREFRVYSDEYFEVTVTDIEGNIVGGAPVRYVGENYQFINENPNKGYYELPLRGHFDRLSNGSILHLNIKVADMYSNIAYYRTTEIVEDWIKLYIDTEEPQRSYMRHDVNGKIINLTWNRSRDEGSGVQGYQLYVNNIPVEDELFTDTNYTYEAENYNQELEVKLYAHDHVGNRSLSQRKIYTDPEPMSILDININGDISSGYSANIVLPDEVQASNYEIKYYEVNAAGQRVLPDYYDKIESGLISETNCQISGLGKHKYYQFEVRTVGGNLYSKQYSDWIPYSEIVQVINNLPEPPTLIEPLNSTYYNSNNIHALNLRATVQSDPDEDNLYSTFYITDLNNQIIDTHSSAVNNYLQTVEWSPALDDGTYLWYLSVNDGYGADVYSTKRKIHIDTTPPTPPMFDISDIYRKADEETVELENIKINDSDVVKLKAWLYSEPDNFKLYDPTERVQFTLPTTNDIYTICLQGIDVAGNEGEIYQKLVYYDVLSPNNPATLTSESKTNEILIEWDGSSDHGANSSGIDYYELQYAKLGSSIWSSPIKITSTNYLLAGLQDNAGYNFRLRTYDKAGNVSDEYIQTEGYSLPSIGSLELMEINPGNLGEYVASFSMNIGNSASYQIKRKDIVTGVIEESSWISSSEAIYHEICQANSRYEYQIITQNSAQNPSMQTSNWSVEIVVPNTLPPAPVNTVSGFINQLRPLLNCQTFPDHDRDTVTYYYFVQKESGVGEPMTIINWAEANNGHGYQLSTELEDGCTYSYQVGADDGKLLTRNEMGDLVPEVISTKTLVTIDKTPPEIETSVPEEVRLDIEQDQYVSEVEVTVHAEDRNSLNSGGNASGLASLYYYWDNDLSTKRNISSGQTINGLHGAHTLYIVAKDQMDNTSLPVTIPLKVDTTAPEISNVRLHGTNYQGQEYSTNLLELFASFTLTDPESKVCKAWYYIATAEEMANSYMILDSDWIPINLLSTIQQNYQISIPKEMAENETYYLIVKAENAVGRNHFVSSNGIKIDSKPPVILFQDREGSIPDRYLLTNLTDLTLDGTVEDQGVGVAKVEYGLARGRDLSTIETWYSDLATVKNMIIEDGVEYYLVIRAEDYLGHISSEFSVPIIVDRSAPNFERLMGGDPLPGSDQYQTQQETDYLKVFWHLVDETELTKLEYAIGTTPGNTDISAQIPGQVSGWVRVREFENQMSYVIDNLNLASGKYYITIRVTNAVGLSTTLTANPIEVNADLEKTPVLLDDGIYTNRDEIHFSVSFPTPNMKNTQYYYQLVDQDDQVILATQPLQNEERLDNISVTLANEDEMNLENGKTYFVVLGEKVNQSFIPIAYTNGITIDLTEPEILHFNDGHYFTKENVHLVWDAQDLESGIQRSYLQLGTTRGGSEITNGWIDLGNYQEVSLPGDYFIEEKRYFATLKVRNGAGNEKEMVLDGFWVDNTAPPIPQVHVSGNYTTRTDRLSASWVWTQLDSVSGNQGYYYDYLTVRDATVADWKPIETLTGDPLATAIELTNLDLDNGQTYYFAIKAVNGVGLESVGFSEGIMVDVEAPETPIIVDDGYAQSILDSLNVTFTSADYQSGLDKFEFSVGTWGDETKVANWQESTLGSERLQGLQLDQGEVYYFTVLAKDNAGLKSAIRRSDGILIDPEVPEITSLTTEGKYTVNNQELFFQWDAKPSFAPIVEYRYDLSTEANPINYHWKTTREKQLLLLADDETEDGEFANTTYYLHLQAVDAGGKVSPMQTTQIMVESTPPTTPVLDYFGEYQGQHVGVGWSSSDPETGISQYRYGIGSERGLVDVTGGWQYLEASGEHEVCVLTDLSLQHNQRYYLAVQAQNGCGVWSEVGLDNGFIADLEAPEVLNITGPKYATLESPLPEFDIRAVEGETLVNAYRYQLFLLEEQEGLVNIDSDQINIDPPIKELETRFEANNRDLKDGQKYFLGLQVCNTLGQWSEVKLANEPVTVDYSIPLITLPDADNEVVTNNEDGQIPLSISENATLFYRIKCPDGSFTAQEFMKYGDIEVEQAEINVVLPKPGTYTIYFYAIDQAGNQGETVEQKVRWNKNPVVRVQGLGERTVYKGRGLAIDETLFSVVDLDGSPAVYAWEFGDGDITISDDCSIYHTYREIGTYVATLTVTDNDGGQGTAQATVQVINTLEGELKLDEVWKGEMKLLDNLTVPRGVRLQIEAGTTIIIPKGKGIIVQGSLECSGESGEILFTTFDPLGYYGPNLWNGIYVDVDVEGQETFIFNNVHIQYASRGLIINQRSGQISNSSFTENEIGLHLNSSEVVVEQSIFANNAQYGIKEERDCTPQILNSSFLDNGISAYYDTGQTLINPNLLNMLDLNSGNQ